MDYIQSHAEETRCPRNVVSVKGAEDCMDEKKNNEEIMTEIGIGRS